MDESAAVSAMGEDVLAACAMIPSGFALRSGVRTVGAVGGGTASLLAAGAAADRMRKDTAPGDHEGDLYLTVGRSQVAIFDMKRGLFRKSIGRLLVQFPRAEIASVDFRRSKMGASAFDLELTDGVRYELQAARVNRAKAERVYALLQGGD